MEENLSLQQILEWYIDAGVNETVGDAPFAKTVAEEVKKDADKPYEKIRDVSASAVPRQATTVLAQATNNACQNARELCLQINDLDELRKVVEDFEGCALKLTAAHTVFGDGCKTARVMLIGEAPGADEDRIGRPFVGRSGQLLDKMMAAIGMDRSKYYITNVLPWRPPGNRTPTEAEIAVCLPFLKRQIDLINPDFILVLGGSAANALLDNGESISRMRGRWHEYKKSDGSVAQVLASFHPAYLLRNAAQKAKVWSDLLRLAKNIQ